MVPSNVQVAMVPSNVQVAMVPSKVQVAMVPTNVQVATVPSKVQVAMVPTNVQVRLDVLNDHCHRVTTQLRLIKNIIIRSNINQKLKHNDFTLLMRLKCLKMTPNVVNC
jgi:hypothetical protein